MKASVLRKQFCRNLFEEYQSLNCWFNEPEVIFFIVATE